jgi:uncharacterized membrane protein YjdF
MALDGLKTRAGIAREFLRFFWHSKNWWFTPVIRLLLLLVALMALAETAPLAPFLYTLF